MQPPIPSDLPPRVRAIESALKMLRYLGMLGFLGGLAALSAMWAFGKPAVTQDDWRMLVGNMRPIFFACVFMGIVVLAVAGTISWWRHRRALHASRWFRVMIGLLIVAVPALHLTARGIALRMYAAVEAGQLDQAAQLWDELGWLFLIGFVVMLLIAAIGIFKPRFGERGAR